MRGSDQRRVGRGRAATAHFVGAGMRLRISGAGGGLGWSDQRAGDPRVSGATFGIGFFCVALPEALNIAETYIIH